MTEYDFTMRIIDTARLFGWLAVWFRPARTGKGWRTPLSGDTGYPDLTLARDGVVLHVELKVGSRKPRPDQVAWGLALGDTYRLWYPDDWDDIVVELKAHRAQ